VFIKNIYLETKDFFYQIWSKRTLIFELTKRDFRIKYSANLFGLTWAIIEPLAMMVILWFVFTYLRAGQSTTVPYSLFLLSGIIAYDFFNKSMNATVKSIKSYSFLIQKVNFRIAVIPIVKILSEIIIHLIVIIIVAAITLAVNVSFSVYWFQVFYYILASVVLLIGIAWATSSIALFFPDINYIITIVMRLAFFFTPIFWTADRIPEKYLTYIQLNPLYYIVTGYRDSFLFNVGFWERPKETLIYWSITIFFLIIGVSVFKRLRPHFADVI
jgi:lipopolysaccharide transport system permease protein/teichoic acid transport system permease protein